MQTGATVIVQNVKTETVTSAATRIAMILIALKTVVQAKTVQKTETLSLKMRT
jgi:hypothetical protein